MNKVYDCFSFFNEHAILDIRLNTLYDYVDKFILVEATKSHQNKDKPLYFSENKDLYEKFLDKIIHIVVDNYPDFSYWSFEEHQRDQIFPNLMESADRGDIVFISDVDEIWNPEILMLTELDSDTIYEWPSIICYSYFNLAAQRELWYQPIMCKFSLILDLCGNKKYSISRDLLRNKNNNSDIKYVKMNHPMGWHFSYTEDPSYKLKNFLHSEYGNMSNENYFDKLKSGENPFHGNQMFIIRDMNYPKYITENPSKFSKYFLND
jgi:beta-1,4-mannosyl-glycoprotein beta-1,4-N-acetylglucosaminyltransferase